MPQVGRRHARTAHRARYAPYYGLAPSTAGVVDEASSRKDQSLNVAISTQEGYWTTPRDHRTHPPAALSPSRRLRGSAYHHVLTPDS